MADPWEEAAKQFKPSSDAPTSAGSSSDQDWRVWQQSDGNPAASQRFATNDQPLFPKAAAAFRNLQEKVSPYISWLPRAETLMGMAMPVGSGGGGLPALMRGVKAGGPDIAQGAFRAIPGHRGIAQVARGIGKGIQAARANPEPIDTATGSVLHDIGGGEFANQPVKPIQFPERNLSPEEMGIHGGVENTPMPKANGRAEPFAENQPFSPSKAARQQTPATAKGEEPKGVQGNPRALKIAKQLKNEMAKE